MKILKLVLIALVTVSIYSFTTNPISKEEKVNSKKEISQDRQVRIYFLPGLTEAQKKKERSWVQCNYKINLHELIENSNGFETWTYSKWPGTTNGNVTAGGGDLQAPPQDPSCDGGDYVSVQFNFDPNAPSFTFN